MSKLTKEELLQKVMSGEIETKAMAVKQVDEKTWMVSLPEEMVIMVGFGNPLIKEQEPTMMGIVEVIMKALSGENTYPKGFSPGEDLPDELIAHAEKRFHKHREH